MIALAAKQSGLSKQFISNLNASEDAVMGELYLSTSVVQQAITAQDQAIKQIAGRRFLRHHRPGSGLRAARL